MARPLRLDVPGGFYHVMSRGNERREIFLDAEDRRRFLDIFSSVTKRSNVLCHTYCLMGNHYHLLLETPDGNISSALRQLNGVYAQSFNRRHLRLGHLFQGRFKSILIEKETYLLAVARYIVQNPVRAGLVGRPSDWEWSSYLAIAGRVSPPTFLEVEWLLRLFNADDRQRAHEDYCRFVEQTDVDDERIRCEGPILGSDEFIKQFRDELATSAPLKDIPRTQRFAARRTLELIFQNYESRSVRNSLVHDAHVLDGYTMTEIANHLGLHVMTISRAVRECKMLEC